MESPLPKFLTRILLVLTIGGLLGWNIWTLWNTRPEDVSGDVLIHLIFARNRVAGHPNEFNLGEKSRALTSVSWNQLLAVTGAALDVTQKNQAYLDLARALAIVITGLSLVLVYHLSRQLGGSRETGLLAAGFGACSPITFYWCAANPMETSLAILLVLALLWMVIHAVKYRLTAWHSAGCAGLGLALLTTRPELAAVSALAWLSMVGSSRRGTFRSASKKNGTWESAAPWRSALIFAAAWLVLLAGGWSIFHALDLPLLPNAVSARRLIVALRDAETLFGVPFSKDAWLLAGVFLPFLLAAVWQIWQGNSVQRSAALFVMGTLGFSVLFFSFYFCTTWQGRYLLPALFGVWAVGLAALMPRPVWWTRLLLTVYLLGINLALLHPLAGYAQAPAHRAWTQRNYLIPDASVKTLLVQEIQAAYFHPQIHYWCTEGLIALETDSARSRDLTTYDFVLEKHPDWIGTGRYPLRDPDNLEALIRDAAFARRDFQCRAMRGIYLGDMAGCGPVFRLEYGAAP